MNAQEFSDYIVYVDESGHASPEPDPNFPCFVLAFCLFEKTTYCTQVVPAVQKLKFDFFGHDMVVLHEREIRKSSGPFTILQNRHVREPFLTQLTGLLQQTEFAILHRSIHKAGQHAETDNLYHIAAQSCLEALFDKIVELGEPSKITFVVFERRGTNEDRLLELEFRRICGGDNRHGAVYPFAPVFSSKQSNSTGLQFADLVARPIGLAMLRPNQKNRTYNILASKDIRPALFQADLDL